MTLPLPALDRPGGRVKIKVSDHVVCCWTWGIVFDEDHAEDETGFILIMRKSHPLWELTREIISHLPSFLPSWVSDTDWFARREEKHSVDVASVGIPDLLAKTLYFPIWQSVHDDYDD